MKEKDNILKKGTPVFYLAKDSKHIKRAKVVTLSYRVLDDDGKYSVVDSSACSTSIDGMLSRISEKVKNRILLAYFQAVGKISEDFLFDLKGTEDKPAIPEVIALPMKEATNE